MRQRRARDPAGVADAVAGNWVDRLAPLWSRPYLRLSRADRPIGTWLLLLPCWWGLSLAMLSDGRAGWGDAWIAVGCAIGAWLMRGAGCTWNDITDRDIDGAVARTRSRPIPIGPGQRPRRARLAGDPEPAGVSDPFDLRCRGDRPRHPVAAAGLPLSVRQALYLVAAGVSRDRVQLGRAPGLGGPYRQPVGRAGRALSRRHRLDAVLRHDLRPSGRRGRRADRSEVHRPPVRRRDARPGCAGSSSPWSC